MAAVSKLAGFREASRQLNDMKRRAAQGVGRRALLVPAGILRDEMEQRAPLLTGDLKASVVIERERAKRGRPQVAVVAGDIASIQVEFGNHHQPAEPFARPAADAKQTEMFQAFAGALRSEIDSTVIRAGRARG